MFACVRNEGSTQHTSGNTRGGRASDVKSFLLANTGCVSLPCYQAGSVGMHGHRAAVCAGAEASGAAPGSRTDAPRGGLVHGREWRKCEELGRGAHGTVYRAELLDTGESIAVKQILTSVVGKSDVQQARERYHSDECTSLRSTTHGVMPLFVSHSCSTRT